MDIIRKDHNLAKRTLIQSVLPSNGSSPSVLDVGCGYGGDIKKWFMTNPRISLDMCDPSDDALKEARSRAESMGFSDRVQFYHGDISVCPNKKYNFICYNFSLHYIFENAKLFFKSIDEIRKRLLPGGVLFGCIPDSEHILNMTPFQDDHGNFFARNMSNTGFGGFGEKVFVNLVDTPYYADGPKAEPIAYKDLLITYLEQRRLRLVNWSPHASPHSISKLYSQFIFVYKC